MQKLKLQFKIQNYLFIGLALLFFALPVFASNFMLNTDGAQIGIGQQFEVRLILDTQGKVINAVEGQVKFLPDFLALKEVRDGNSIINFWVERPSAAGDVIKWSGIVPGGYNGQSGLIFSLIFEAKKAGQAEIFLENFKALLNDGQGTEDAASVKNLLLKIGKTGNASAPVISDNDAPETFRPLTGRDKSLFHGKWFLSFAAEDKGSGIDYYQVQERWFLHPGKDGWKKAESPYLLKDQWGISYVFVRAVDKSGNARIVAVPPRVISVFKLLIIFGIIIVAIIIFKMRRKLWRKKN